MTAREKRLGLIVGAAVAVLLLYSIINKVMIAPVAKAQGTIVRLKKSVENLTHENSMEDYYVRRLTSLADRTLGSDEYQVKENVRTRLMLLAGESGLRPETNPISGGRKRGAYREVGATVVTQGRLQKIVDFLYLLRADPHLRQLSGLSISPVPGTKDVKLTIKYTTVVMEGKGPLPSTTQPVNPLKSPTLDDKQREPYQAIVSRDLFRPYVKRRIIQVARPQHRPPVRQDDPAPEPTAPSLETFLRVVSLSQLSDKPEICVFNKQSSEITFYRPGDKFAGGVIAAVDYRQMPRLDNPRILSGSRVIVKIGSTYWAVELGQVLADKHRLRQGQLPLELKSSPSTAPVANIVSTNPKGYVE